MEGPVVWPQLVWIAGIIGGSVAFGVTITLWYSVRTSKDRHTFRSHYDQHIKFLQEQLELAEEKLEQRIRAIELQNAGTLVVLKHVEDFKTEIKDQLERMQKDRNDDMVKISGMLANIHNAQRGIKHG